MPNREGLAERFSINAKIGKQRVMSNLGISGVATPCPVAGKRKTDKINGVGFTRLDQLQEGFAGVNLEK